MPLRSAGFGPPFSQRRNRRVVENLAPGTFSDLGTDDAACLIDDYPHDDLSFQALEASAGAHRGVQWISRLRPETKIFAPVGVRLSQASLSCPKQENQ